MTAGRPRALAGLNKGLAEQVSPNSSHVVFNSPNARDVLGGDDERLLFLLGKIG